MKQKILLTATLLICFTIFSFAQSEATLKVYELHKKMTNFIAESQDVKLPDSVYRILKDYAFTRGLREAAVLRNDYVFKVLYNEALSVEDRLFACDFYIQANNNPYPYTPHFFLLETRKYLSSKNKANK
jgi:hypothetical protein